MRAYSFSIHSIAILGAIAASACGFPTVDIAPAEGTTSSTSGVGSGGHGGAAVSVTSVAVTSTSTTNGTGGAASTSNNTVASSVSSSSTAQSTSASGSGGAVNCDVDGDGYKGAQCGGDDCDDGDDRTYPTQTTFFSNFPSKTTMKWDFNCDGLETKEYAMAVLCNAGGQCVMDNLFVGVAAPPACGVAGPFGDCVNNVLSCKPASLGVRTQACN